MNLFGKIMPSPINGGLKMDGYWIWCPSVIKGEDNKYHMFASRWKKYYLMHPGWMLNSEIIRAVSDTPEGPYEFQEVVLTTRGAEFWDGRCCHNPRIKKYGDDYILYYMGSTHPFTEAPASRDIDLDDPRVIVLRSNKRIGMAISKSIYGPWERFDEPILTTRASYFDNFLVSNPAPYIEKDGSVKMIYKARTYKKDLHSPHLQREMVFGVAMADNYKGKYKQVLDEPLFGWENEIEDPFVWKENDIYCMIAKDMTGNVCGEKFAGIYAESEDFINWKIKKGEKSYSRTIQFDDGSVKTFGKAERPFILFEDNVPTHMFFAVAEGVSRRGEAEDTYNICVPLKH